MIRFLKVTLTVLCALVLIVSLWFVAGVLWSLPLVKPNDKPVQLLIANVSVVDVESGQVLREHDILVESGLIGAVGPNLSAPGAQRVEGRDLYAIPGLFDMHVHSTKMAPVLTHPLLIAAGVTAVRDMGGCIGIEDGFVACIDEKREWNRAVAAGEMVGPRFDQLSSLAINGGREIPGGVDVALGAPTAAGARQRVALDRERGVDFLKTYTMLPREGYFELARVAAEAGLYLAGHLPLAISAPEAIEAGQRSIEHAFLFIWDCYPGMSSLRQSDNPREVFTRELRETMIAEHDAAQCANLHRAMVEAGTAFVPTHTTRKLDAFSLDEAFRTDQRLKYIPGPLRQMWLSDADGMARRAGQGGQQSYMDFYRFGIRQTGIAHKAGVTVLAGSDMPDSFAFPGTAIHDELDHLVEAGLSPLDALRAATLEPARFLGLDGEAGIIRPGARADLVLLRTNPLQNIRGVRQIEGVVLAGAPYRRDDLDRMLETVESAAGSWSMWPKFIWQILTSPIMKRQFGD
jgi:imidazolonepropionase-like amidohydrolase